MTLYLIRAACPNCERVVDLVEETEAPIPLDQAVPITTTYCPTCGISIPAIGAEWDVHEEAEVERVEPSD